MKRKKLVMLMAASAVALSLVACGGSADSGVDEKEGTVTDLAEPDGAAESAGTADETVEINMWSGMTGADADVMQSMAGEFMEENPDIKVSFTSVTWSEMFTKWQQAFNSDLGPDVMMMHSTDICNYAPNDMLMPLDEISSSLGIDSADYSEAAWAGVKNGGTLYGIPLDFHCMGVFKNVEMFEEAGLDPNMTFETEEDFLNACKALSDSENGKYAVGIGSNYAHTYRYWYSLLYQFNGSFVNDDFTEAEFASEEGKKALDWIAALPLELKYAPYNEQDIDADFLNGTCAMVIDGPWFIPTVLESGMEFTTTAFPQIGETPAVWANSHVVTLPVESGRSEKEQEAAERLLVWIIEHSYEWGSQSGQIPANAAVRESEEYKASEVYPYVQAFVDQKDYIKYEPLCAGTAEFGADNELSPVMSAVTNIVSGNTDDTMGELESAAKSVTNILNE
jgi:multiple sugar transport system substrate-binding protein